MRQLNAQIFLSGAAICGIGFTGLRILEKNPGFAFLQGALTLGGGLMIAGLFALKMRWHGIIGAGVLALLGTTRGLGNSPDFLEFLTGRRDRGIAPLLEIIVTALCLLLLFRVASVLLRERTRRRAEALRMDSPGH